MIHLAFDVPCSNQLIVSPLFRGNSPYPYRSLTYRTNAEYHIKSRFVKQNFSRHGEKARTSRGGAQPYDSRRQAEGPEAEGNQVVTRNAPSGGAVCPPALRQPSEIKNSFVQWTKEFSWQREKDSNPHIRSQSPLCYPYTIPLCSQRTDIIIAAFSNLSIGK